jgi:hypothetical protein
MTTLGEANLLIKNKAKSTECYVQARKLACNDWGKVTSVHNQLWLLNHFPQRHVNVNPDIFAALISPAFHNPVEPTSFEKNHRSDFVLSLHRAG